MILSEVVPDNQKTLRDEEGDYEDWIELQNVTDQDIPLAGWHLSDDPVNPHPWTFPEITLPARGFLVVFASGKNRSGVTNCLHTDFKLKSEGEYLGLSAPDHVIVDAFAPRYPPHRPTPPMAGPTATPHRADSWRHRRRGRPTRFPESDSLRRWSFPGPAD